jgi:hypothetical protein
MPILVLPTQRDLFTVTGVNAATYRSDIFRGLGAAAFGTAEPLLENRPLGLDAVALKIRDKLNELGLKRKLAAVITRGFFDRWVEGVSFAEHAGQSIVFVVVELDPKKFGDRPWVCAVGPTAKLDDYIRTLPSPRRRILFVDLREMLDDIRKRGVKAGLDMSAHFFVPPDHPALAEVREHWETWRAEHKLVGAVGEKHPKFDKSHRKTIESLLH